MTAIGYPNEIYTVFAFFGFVMSLIPLPWHLQAYNTGTVSFMIWAAIGNFNYFVNSIVWKGRVTDFAPVWCDITTHLTVAINVALICSTLCINRRLYCIATSNNVMSTRADKRRAVMVDLAICVGIPVIAMIVYYIPQGHRYNILEDIGCYPTVYNTWVAYVLVYGWPPVISLVSFVYSMLNMMAFYKRRQQFKELLAKNNKLNTDRYMRLMLLAGVDAVFTLPFSIWFMVSDIQIGVHPWISWEDTHFEFGKAWLMPALLWKTDPTLYRTLEVSRWSVVICAFLFFIFFGFADEAMKNYRLAYSSVTKTLGFSSTGSVGTTLAGSQNGKSMTATGNSLPVFVKHDVHRKRDSLDSFTDIGSVAASGMDMKESTFDPNASFGGLSLNDVGGTLTASSPPSPSSSSYTEKDEVLGDGLPELKFHAPQPEPVKKDDPSNMV